MAHVAAVAMLAALASISACGSANQPEPVHPSTNPATSTPSGAGSTLSYRLTMSGPDPIAEQLPPTAVQGRGGQLERCGQFVAGSEMLIDIQGNTQNGTRYRLTLDILPYNGPGTYTTSTLLPVDLLVGPPQGPTVQYEAPRDSTAKLTGVVLRTQGNGSGTFTMTNWLDMASGRTESGVLGWTCKDG
ncbi:MAG: hypothetical protein JF886_01790 [Candidatus Dormibacteraeota bacterium]|uniref:Lipoprotein n=1 Tax=Candidatus Aeolococcus gillhamiae TaxID=3127015 RepID=A0A2W5Z4Y4_9BACT|nr:hypothetical protein [Candidatus Dormibacteraeota bacterium]PZR80399.1 MAG: hypothetical protein DLM65_08170 [Candidatus Dormibacter sp. RRmetagenome_bin12]